MLKIEYTDHSLQRLNERGISKAQIKAAIQEGEKYDTSEDLRKSRYRNEHGTIVVIYRVKSIEEIVIITAYRE